MALTRTSFVLLSLLVVAISWTRSDNNDHQVDAERPYHTMHKHYDGTLGNNDGFVSYDEIKRALGGTQEEDWKKEIEPHDDGNKLLDATEFENWLTSFKKQEL